MASFRSQRCVNCFPTQFSSISEAWLDVGKVSASILDEHYSSYKQYEKMVKLIMCCSLSSYFTYPGSNHDSNRGGSFV